MNRFDAAFYDDFLSQLQAGHSWQSRYQVILQSAKRLPSHPEIQFEKNRVVACEAKTWMTVAQTRHHYHFIIDSESRIIKGLALILLAHCDGKTSKDIQSIDLEKMLIELGLEKHLSPSRSNGFKALYQKIRELSLITEP